MNRWNNLQYPPIYLLVTLNNPYQTITFGNPDTFGAKLHSTYVYGRTRAGRSNGYLVDSQGVTPRASKRVAVSNQ